MADLGVTHGNHVGKERKLGRKIVWLAMFPFEDAELSGEVGWG